MLQRMLAVRPKATDTIADLSEAATVEMQEVGRHILETAITTRLKMPCKQLSGAR